jgi:hypothetical protein
MMVQPAAWEVPALERKTMRTAFAKPSPVREAAQNNRKIMPGCCCTNPRLISYLSEIRSGRKPPHRRDETIGSAVLAGWSLGRGSAIDRSEKSRLGRYLSFQPAP